MTELRRHSADVIEREPPTGADPALDALLGKVLTDLTAYQERLYPASPPTADAVPTAAELAPKPTVDPDAERESALQAARPDGVRWGTTADPSGVLAVMSWVEFKPAPSDRVPGRVGGAARGVAKAADHGILVSPTDPPVESTGQLHSGIAENTESASPASAGGSDPGVMPVFWCQEPSDKWGPPPGHPGYRAKPVGRVRTEDVQIPQPETPEPPTPPIAVETLADDGDRATPSPRRGETPPVEAVPAAPEPEQAGGGKRLLSTVYGRSKNAATAVRAEGNMLATELVTGGLLQRVREMLRRNERGIRTGLLVTLGSLTAAAAGVFVARQFGWGTGGGSGQSAADTTATWHTPARAHVPDAVSENPPAPSGNGGNTLQQLAEVELPKGGGLEGAIWDTFDKRGIKLSSDETRELLARLRKKHGDNLLADRRTYTVPNKTPEGELRIDGGEGIIHWSDQVSHDLARQAAEYAARDRKSSLT